MTNKTNPPGLMTLAEIAQRIDIGENSIRTYHARSAVNRRNGNPRPGDLPAPDFIVGRSPLWQSETINSWVESRPGRGSKNVQSV